MSGGHGYIIDAEHLYAVDVVFKFLNTVSSGLKAKKSDNINRQNPYVIKKSVINIFLKNQST